MPEHSRPETPSFGISINPKIHDKPASWDPAFASGWQSRDASLEELADFVTRGTAFIPAAMSSDHRSSAAFLHADLAVVDIDQGLSTDDFQQHPLAQYASLLYTTASHRDEPGGHRFRVVFQLPERISDPGLYKAVVTHLIKVLGGDKSCTDPCRLFYGNSAGAIIWLHQSSTLPQELIEEARRNEKRERARFHSATDQYDELTIQQAIHVLESVLDPTADGERDHFIRVTAACASAGDVLYPYWSDWASRGHHGKGKNARQTSERFFQGFSGKSTLATLFFLANDQDPEWRKGLPEELRSTGGAPRTHKAIGYDHEDFLGIDPYDLDPFEAELQQLTDQQQGKRKTLSMFDANEEYWENLRQRQNQQQSVDDEPLPESEPPTGSEDFSEEPDFSEPPSGKRGKGRPKRVEGDELETIRLRVKALYPGLRFNTLNLTLEHGPRETPKIIEQPQYTYVYISRGTDKVFPKHTVQDTAYVVAWENRYNPVITYLESCAANCEPIDYFDSIASTLLGTEEDSTTNPILPSGQPYADVVMQRFLIGAVARALDPGCTHDWLPILIGSQNVGKSKFFDYLTPQPPSRLDVEGWRTSTPWTATLQQGIGQIKERPHLLHCGWIVVLDEIDRYFKRRYTEELKNLVSTSIDYSSRKYEHERGFPRSFVLAGATNYDDFMVDPTGNRRFMPVKVNGLIPAPGRSELKIVDLDRLKRDRDRIWSAAYKAYIAGAGHTFDSAELQYLADCSEGYTQDSPLTTSLPIVLERSPSFIHKGKPCYTLAHVFESLDLDLKSSTQMLIPVTDGLKRLGYVSCRERVNGKITRFWRKKEDQQGEVRKPWD